MNRVTLGIYVSRFPSIRVVSFILEFTPVAVLSIFFFFFNGYYGIFENYFEMYHYVCRFCVINKFTTVDHSCFRN